MNWYYVDSGKQAGPVDDAQLESLRLSGQIQPDTLVWHEGMANWQPFSEVKPPEPPPISAPPTIPLSIPLAPNPTEAVCSECGKIFPIENMINYAGTRVCAGCKPVFLQKLAEGARVSVRLPWAGFWVRFGAKFIDGLILAPFLLIPLFILIAIKGFSEFNSLDFLAWRLLIQLLLFLLQMGYQIFFLGKYGATPGKMACKLKVVTAEGTPITYGRATGRFFAEKLSGLTCTIGYIIAAFDDQKRTLHDHICGTRVVYKEPA